jgi:hypothetical protein
LAISGAHVGSWGLTLRLATFKPIFMVMRTTDG